MPVLVINGPGCPEIPTSALHPLADSSRTSREVRNVPTGDMRGDLHLISARANLFELLDRNSGASRRLGWGTQAVREVKNLSRRYSRL